MEEGECLIDGWDEPKIREILKQAKENTIRAKKNGDKHMPSVCIVCDDLADNKSAVKGNELLNAIFLRGRHMGVSCILMTQRLRLLDVSLRVNANALFVFRLRNYKDLEAILEEFSAMLNKKQLQEVYEHCTVDRFSFMYMNLNESDPQKAFYRCFDARLSIKSPQTSNGSDSSSHQADHGGVSGSGGDYSAKGGKAVKEGGG